VGSEHYALIVLGAIAGGIVNGMTGFGTGLTVLSIWLYVLSPVVASTLVILCSVVSQLQTLPMIWRAIMWRRVLVFALPGFAGVPIGTLLLPHIDPRMFKIAVGILLIVYPGHVLMRRVEIKSEWGGRAADGVVGFIGGILGALAGLSGVIPVVWTDIRGWTKEQRRGVLQIFNMTVLSLALVSHAVSGMFTRQVGMIAIIVLPGTIAGAWLGSFIYRRLADHSYQRIIMVLLLVSGLSLIWTSV
jgi:hypothetical protein